MSDFQECQQCAEKLGSPTLCLSCLNNRALIGKLKHNQVTELILECPKCGERHIDEGEFENKVHHTHACQHCGFVWRPAVEPTKGVQFLKGFKNAE